MTLAGVAGEFTGDANMEQGWNRVEIANHHADVFSPSAGGTFGSAVLFLHPVGQETLAENAVYTQLLRSLNLPCVSPHGGYTWWTDRISPEFDPRTSAEQHLLNSVIPWMKERFGVEPPRIGLLGISMGGQGALRLAFKHPKQFPVVAAIAPAIDYHEYYGRGLSLDAMYDSKEQCRQDTAPLHIRPDDFPASIFFCIDPTDCDWFRGVDRLHEKLNALGIPHTCDLAASAGGHSWDYFDHVAERALSFIQNGLAAASRRLL